MAVSAGPDAPDESEGMMKCTDEGHWWAYGCGDSSERIPGGTPCECGEVVADYEMCPECGQETLIAVPTNNGMTTIDA